MISLYTGTCGSGKSLHSAKNILEWLSFGRPVIVNFDINLPKKYMKFKKNLHFIDNTSLKPLELEKFSRKYFDGKRVREGKILLIIDECQMMFNSRDWSSSDRMDWLKFFTIHRHFGYDIVLVCQYDRMIDRQIRSVVEHNYIHRKVANFGIKGKILSLLMGGNVFCYVKMWYPINERISATFFHARKKYYSIYDTFNTFE